MIPLNRLSLIHYARLDMVFIANKARWCRQDLFWWWVFGGLGFFFGGGGSAGQKF